MQVTRAVTKRCEAELAAVSLENDAPGHSNVFAGRRIDGKIREPRSYVSERRSTRNAYGIGIDATRAKALELDPADPLLFRQVQAFGHPARLEGQS